MTGRRKLFQALGLLAAAACGGCSSGSASPTRDGAVAGGGASAAGGIGGAGSPGNGSSGSRGSTTGSGGAAGGEAGTAGSVAPGTAGTSGIGGLADTRACTISAQSSLSSAVPTVAIVNWTTNLTTIGSAEIQFGLADGTGPTMVAPVDLTQAGYRTLLLGMKGNRAYTFQIVIHTSSGPCTSQIYTLTTGPVSTGIPNLTVQIATPAAHDRGFIVTTSASNGTLPNIAYILDADGDPVWWASAPSNPSRAHMSWDGNTMWIEALNVQNTGGEMRQISMDGSTSQNNVSGLAASHHDFTPIPGNGIAAMLWKKSGTNVPNSLVERASDGTITTIVADFSSLYNSPTFHPNAIHYYPSDDTYTISDRDPNLFVKITREGQLLWQFGGTNPKDSTKFFAVAGGTWQVNHGHQLLDNGHFLFFNNGPNGGPSIVREYQLDTTTWTASSVWTYQMSGVTSTVLGDTQRLSNGNTLITFSTTGQIQEVDPTGSVVMTIKPTGASSTFGYADFRASLYGQPPR